MTAITEATKRDSMEATTIPDLASKMDETTLHKSTTTSSRPIKATLTSLPPSVRNRIYTHLLDTELVNLGAPNVSYTPSLPNNTNNNGLLTLTPSRTPFPVSTALFYVNKRISHEARALFYSRGLWVRLSIYTAEARHAKNLLLDSGLLFVANEAVQRCAAHAADITLVERGSAAKRAVVNFPAQYLPRLVNFMRQASAAGGAWAPAHKLWLGVHRTYGLDVARVQGDLLEGFRVLTGLGGMEVEDREGLLVAGYAEGLQESMMAERFDAGMWARVVGNMVERAEEDVQGKRWDDAVQQAQTAVIAMTYGYLTRAETLHSQPEEFTKSVQRLRWRAELVLGTALISKHHDTLTASSSSPSWLSDANTPIEQGARVAKDLLLAESSASHALSLSTDSSSPSSNPWVKTLPAELIPPNKAEWFTDEERGRSWYACGLAHIALGECLFAAGDLERAERLWPRGAGVEEAFTKAREGIDWNVRPGTGLKKAATLARRGE